MSRWLRINEDCIDHPKLLKLPEALRWQWVALLCVASKNGGVLPPIDDVALCLRVTEAKAAEYITKLVKAKLIDKQGDVFVPHNWDKRQFKSDSSTERVKRHRETKRNVSTTVTRNVSSGVSETVTETAPEAEAETEAESQQSRADASAPISEELKDKAAGLRAGVSAHFLAQRQPIPNLDRCLLWLTMGYSQDTVLEAIQAVLKRGKPISTLEYFDGAIKDRHPKAVQVAALVDTMADWYLIVEGTPEEVCWQQHTKETTGRPMFICDQINELGRTVRGAKKPTLFPPGYNDFGERVPPKSSEDAA